MLRDCCLSWISSFITQPPPPAPRKLRLGGYSFQVVCLSVTFKFLSRGVENGAGWGERGERRVSDKHYLLTFLVVF